MPTILSELKEFGVPQRSDHQVKPQVYDEYLVTLSQHVTNRFLDVSLLEEFSTTTIPPDLSLPPNHGSDNLHVLIDHYGPHNVIDSEATKTELRAFNIVVAAKPELKQLTIQELMRDVCLNFNVMFLSHSKFAVGRLVPISTVDCV